jgi:hypothetical protein
MINLPYFPTKLVPLALAALTTISGVSATALETSTCSMLVELMHCPLSDEATDLLGT